MTLTSETNDTALIDLTKMVVKSSGLTTTDIALIVVGGGIGYLAKRALEHFFPQPASPEEQVRNMALLLEAGARAGAKKMTFRLSSNAGFSAALAGKNFTIQNPTTTTIDLAVEFA